MWWCLPLPYVVQAPLCFVLGGRGRVRLAGRPIFQMYLAAQKAVGSLTPFYHTLPCNLTGQQERIAGGACTNPILFRPPIVCVQWPITVGHTITNPAHPSPHETPIGIFPRSQNTHRYAPLLPGSSGSFNALSSQFWLSGNRLVSNGPAELVSAASSILNFLSNISAISQLSSSDQHHDWLRQQQPPHQDLFRYHIHLSQNHISFWCGDDKMKYCFAVKKKSST